MKILLSAAGFLGACLPLLAEAIIGYDGKEITYGAHRDGLHDRALHEIRRRDLRHAKLQHLDPSHLPHMLNQAPMPTTVKHRTNHTGRASAKNVGRQEPQDSATALSRISRENAGNTEGDEDISERIATRLNRIAHAHVRGSRRQQHVKEAKASSADRFAKEFTMKDAPIGLSPPVPAPAPGPMNAPGPAPAPMQASGGFGTMDEDMGAPEQGFRGKIVEHDNMITMTKDWRGEYGPNAEGLTSYVKICAQYPDNAWCRERGYHRTTPPPKASALRPAISIFFAAVCALVSFSIA